MSYDVSLIHPDSGDVIELDEPHHMKGGTYEFGGSWFASLNITYNYSMHFRDVGERGIRTIYGMTGADSLPLLKKAADMLDDDTDDDYWKPTEGNAKAALLHLITLATLCPRGIWDGD